MTELIIKGGIMMYPITISSVIAFAVIIERIYIFFIKTKFLEREKIAGMYISAEKGEIKKALALMENEQSIFANLFISILKEKDPAYMEEAALLSGEEILFYLKRRLSLLSVLGSVLPLMGLLGTVLGMIKVFTKVANAGNAADISILAGGIWEALITTAAGMIIAIPVILIYHFFNRTIEKISHSMQQKVSRLIMILKKQEQNNGQIQRQQ